MITTNIVNIKMAILGNLEPSLFPSCNQTQANWIVEPKFYKEYCLFVNQFREYRMKKDYLLVPTRCINSIALYLIS